MARRKKPTFLRRLLRISVPALLWLIFVWWYSNTGGPVTQPEINELMAVLETRGTDPEQRELLREFLQNDTGDDFVMLNLIELNRNGSAEDPLLDARSALDRYMEHMWPALLKRACHPVSFGTTAANAIDLWGIDGANRWTQGAMMRYRSRRDLAQIVLDPDIQGPHEEKIAAMRKTIAIPLDPWFHMGDPRLLFGLIALVLSLIGMRR